MGGFSSEGQEDLYLTMQDVFDEIGPISLEIKEYEGGALVPKVAARDVACQTDPELFEVSGDQASKENLETSQANFAEAESNYEASIILIKSKAEQFTAKRRRLEG